MLPPDEVRRANASAKEQAKEQASADKLDRDRDKLLEAAGHFPDGETFSCLRDRAGLSGTAARNALADTLELGELEHCEITKNGRNESGYRLRSDRSD